MKETSHKQHISKRYKAGELLELDEAATLFAERDSRPGNGTRGTKSRWRNRITYAKDHGKLSTTNNKYQIEHLVRWAIGLTNMPSGWAQKLSDLPAATMIQSAYSSSSLRMTSYFEGYVLPATLEASRDEINRLNIENRKLQKEIEALRYEIALLRPKAVRYDSICKTNSESPRKRQTEVY